MNIKMKIMLRAVNIRLSSGENLEDILNSYPRLTMEEREIIRTEINKSNQNNI